MNTYLSIYTTTSGKYGFRETHVADKPFSQIITKTGSTATVLKVVPHDSYGNNLFTIRVTMRALSGITSVTERRAKIDELFSRLNNLK